MYLLSLIKNHQRLNSETMWKVNMVDGLMLKLKLELAFEETPIKSLNLKQSSSMGHCPWAIVCCHYFNLCTLVFQEGRWSLNWLQVHLMLDQVASNNKVKGNIVILYFYSFLKGFQSCATLSDWKPAFW